MHKMGLPQNKAKHTNFSVEKICQIFYICKNISILLLCCYSEGETWFRLPLLFKCLEPLTTKLNEES